MLAVVDLGFASRLRYALRAAVAFALASAVFGGFFYFGYDLTFEEGPRFAFWSALGTVFVALSGSIVADWLAARSVRFSVFFAASYGFMAGIFWAFTTSFPSGLFPGRLEIPIIIVWPLAGTFAFAYADAAQPRRQQSGRLVISLAFALLTASWIPLVKSGLQQAAGERVDFARMNPPRRFKDPHGFSIHAAPRGNCVDPAPVGRVIEDSRALEELATFEDYRVVLADGRSRLIGYMARLWSVDDQLTGVFTTWLGSGQSYVGWIDGIRSGREGREIHFRAFYPDGYFDEFRGSLRRGRLEGSLTTADVLCVRRVMSTTEVTLKRQDSRPTYPLGLPRPTTMAQLRAFHSEIFRRKSQP